MCLEQVANLNPKDNSYSLKDFMYRDVQRDWPGYSEDERSQVDRTLARYLVSVFFFSFTSLDSIVLNSSVALKKEIEKKVTKTKSETFSRH